MADVKTKSVAGMSQAEITIIEEKLSMVHGTLPVEIAGALSNRFDKVLDEMNKNRSQLAYVENIIPGKSLEVKQQRIKKIADINKEKVKLQIERQELIAGWHKKVLDYIVKSYGEPIKSESGLIIAYGNEGRIEVKKNRHLKKLW